MKISIEPYKFIPNPELEITSSNIFQPNQRKVSDEYKYDENGIFSQSIFGRVGKCECGELKQPGFCKQCQTKVVDLLNLPDYYIDLGIQVPKLYVDYGDFKKSKDLFEYSAYLQVDGDKKKIVSIENEDDFIDEENIYIGVEAAEMLTPGAKEWAERNCTQYMVVPHPVQRPNIRGENNKIIITEINQNFVELMKKIEYIGIYKTFFEGVENNNKYLLLSVYREIYKAYIACCESIFKVITGKKARIVDNQMRAHRISSAIKGVVTNRFDIDEDVVLIGDTFISTLYPYIYKKCDGDMKKINDYLIANDEICLINRAPTIAHYSILAVKPRVASCYSIGSFNNKAIGPNEQSKHIGEEIDTIGVRTIGVNPIITDGFGMDFDGDTALIVPIFSSEAKKEALEMLPSKNFLNFANGEIRNVIPEDIMFATSQIKENE